MKGKILTFCLNNNVYGVDITLVKEINRNVEFTPVPQASGHIAGLFNMRGQIVTLLNLSEILGYNRNTSITKASCIILKPQQGDPDLVGFLIDKPGDVEDVEEDWCDLPPVNISKAEGKYIKELVRLKDKLIMVIDVEKIMSI